MKLEIKTLWTTALRSGEYKQGKGTLRQTSGSPDVPDLFCCWGVLCDLAVKAGVVEERLTVSGSASAAYYTSADPDGATALASTAVLEWAGLEESFGQVPMHPTLAPYVYPEGPNPPVRTSLVSINDNGAPFTLIADTIDREL
jgi:hypothetical protein